MPHQQSRMLQVSILKKDVRIGEFACDDSL